MVKTGSANWKLIVPKEPEHLCKHGRNQATLTGPLFPGTPVFPVHSYEWKDRDCGCSAMSRAVPWPHVPRDAQSLLGQAVQGACPSQGPAKTSTAFR